MIAKTFDAFRWVWCSKLIQSSYITKHDGISVLNLSDKKNTNRRTRWRDGRTDRQKQTGHCGWVVTACFRSLMSNTSYWPRKQRWEIKIFHLCGSTRISYLNPVWKRVAQIFIPYIKALRYLNSCTDIYILNIRTVILLKVVQLAVES